MEKRDDQIQLPMHMEVSSLEQLSQVTDRLLDQLRQWQVDEEKQMDIRLCVMEAVQNGLLYGIRPDGQPSCVHVSWQCSPQGFRFTVEDEGPGVPPHLRKQQTEALSLEEHGRGLLLMQTILDEVCFNEKGNRVTGRMRW